MLRLWRFFCRPYPSWLHFAGYFVLAAVFWLVAGWVGKETVYKKKQKNAVDIPCRTSSSRFLFSLLCNNFGVLSCARFFCFSGGWAFLLAIFCVWCWGSIPRVFLLQSFVFPIHHLLGVIDLSLCESSQRVVQGKVLYVSRFAGVCEFLVRLHTGIGEYIYRWCVYREGRSWTGVSPQTGVPHGSTRVCLRQRLVWDSDPTVSFLPRRRTAPISSGHTTWNQGGLFFAVSSGRVKSFH